MYEWAPYPTDDSRRHHLLLLLLVNVAAATVVVAAAVTAVDSDVVVFPICFIFISNFFFPYFGYTRLHTMC